MTRFSRQKVTSKKRFLGAFSSKPVPWRVWAQAPRHLRRQYRSGDRLENHHVCGVDGTGSGPIKSPQITVPFFASWPSVTSPTGFAGRLNPNYQQVSEIYSRANSTYEAATLRISHNARALTVHARYTYAHAMDWNPDETSQVSGPSVLDPLDFRQEYGSSSLDVRHSATAAVIFQSPWKLEGLAGHLGNGWMLSSAAYFRSGLPYSMRTAGSLAKEFASSGAAIVALSTGMNGYGGDNRVYGVGRNTYRYPATWKAYSAWVSASTLARCANLK